MDEPKSDTGQQNTTAELNQNIDSVNSNDTAEANKHTQQSQPDSKPTRKIVRLFKAAGCLLSPPVEWLDEHHGLMMFLVTAVIGVLTVSYAVYTKKQWEVTQRQLEQSERFFDATQRAFVMLGNKDGKLAEFRQPDKSVIMLHFYNAGPTPAVDFAVQVSSSIGPSSVSEPQLNRYWSSISGRVKITGQPTVAIPGHSGHINYLFEPIVPSKKQFTAIKNGERFSIMGIYIYCDRFGLYSAEYFSIAYIPRVGDFVINLNYPFPTQQMSKPSSPTMEQGATITRLPRCKQPGEDEELKKKEQNGGLSPPP